MPGLPRIDVNDLIERGPDAVLELVRTGPDPDPYDPDINWLLLADACGFEATWAAEREANPAPAARWAGVAADLYERMIPRLRPNDDVMRRIWERAIGHYRERAAGVVTPPVSTVPAASDPSTTAGHSA